MFKENKELAFSLWHEWYARMVKSLITKILNIYNLGFVNNTSNKLC